jgi:hypothetical protein
MAFLNRDDKSDDPLREGKRYVSHITYVASATPWRGEAWRAWPDREQSLSELDPISLRFAASRSATGGGIDVIPGDKDLLMATLDPTRCRSLISIWTSWSAGTRYWKLGDGLQNRPQSPGPG